MIALLEQSGHEGCVRLEVDALNGRIRRKAGPIEHEELEPLGEWTLSGPCPAAAHDAAVDEDDPLHRAIVTCCNEVGQIPFSKAPFWCYKLADMLRPG